MPESYIYILTNRSQTLYIGVTSNLESRLWQHRNKIYPGFTSDYNIDTLIYFEQFDSIIDAITREKQLKRWSRSKKIFLIEQQNPNWIDLSTKLEMTEGVR